MVNGISYNGIYFYPHLFGNKNIITEILVQSILLSISWSTLNIFWSTLSIFWSTLLEITRHAPCYCSPCSSLDVPWGKKFSREKLMRKIFSLKFIFNLHQNCKINSAIFFLLEGNRKINFFFFFSFNFFLIGTNIFSIRNYFFW